MSARFAFMRSLVAAAALFALANAEGRAADIVKYGILRVPDPSMVGVAEGFFAKEGIEVQHVFFRSGAELIPALSTGQIDIAATSPGAALFNAMAQGVKATVVAAYGVLGPDQPGGSPQAIAVRKDLGDKVKSAADAKGLRIAITERGQVTDLFAGKFLESGGLTERDVRIINMPYPDMLPALQGKAIDLAVGIDPFLLIAEREGFAKRLIDMAELAPGIAPGIMMYGERLTTKDRDLGMRFMRAMTRANATLRDNLKSQEGRRVLADIYQKQIPLQDAGMYRDLTFMVGRQKLAVDVDGANGLRSQMQWHIKSGLIPDPPVLENFVDNSFADAAQTSLFGKR